jgi:ABC-2 type transport system ATP-binding protein
MLSTLIKPTSGTASVAGFDILRRPDEVRLIIGLVPQHPLMDRELTVSQNLRFYSKIYRVKNRDERIGEVSNTMDLDDHKHKKTKELSGGYRKRAEIARALLNNPRVLFLDEPTTGLDPIARRVVWGIVRRIVRDYGTTVFLTTHYMEEAEELSDTVAIIDKGEIKASGNPSTLIDSIQGEWISKILTSNPLESTTYTSRIMSRKRNKDYIEYRLRVANRDDAVRTLASLFGNRITIKNIEIRQPNLEDVFIQNVKETDES